MSSWSILNSYSHQTLSPSSKAPNRSGNLYVYKSALKKMEMFVKRKKPPQISAGIFAENVMPCRYFLLILIAKNWDNCFQNFSKGQDYQVIRWCNGNVSYNCNRRQYASPTSSCYFGTLPFNQRTSKFLSSITLLGVKSASALFCYSIYS